MNVVLNKQEVWKILDAIEAYRKNYALSGVVLKTLSVVESKLKNIINGDNHA